MAPALDALVVGSGPNGLAAAIALAQAGRSVRVLERNPTPGGGARSGEATLPGYTHDLCSAIHPLALSSPFFASLGLERHGVEWAHPEVPLAHPLDGGDGAALHRSLERTAEGLGIDGEAWTRAMGPLVRRWRDFSELLLSPPNRMVFFPALAPLFGLQALRSAYGFAIETFEEPRAMALFAGCAAHSMSALEKPLTASFGFALGVAGHAVGWPSPRGGTQKLTDALVAVLRAHGGELELERPVDRLDALPPARVVLFDTSADGMVKICGDALPASYARAVSRFRRGPGVFKLDYALDGPVPWEFEPARRAGTVHLGGTLRELAESERGMDAGELAARPYVLVAQHSVFDPTRAPVGKHTLWAYCHVPFGWKGDATEHIEAQIERFAPGFRKLILHRASKSTAQQEASNPNYGGGDISTGAVEGLQLFFRPRFSLTPWATPNPKVFLCSAATPPGPGVHGMCGYWAAQAALDRQLR
jgi:phytoene dehydrogenase-like protein